MFLIPGYDIKMTSVSWGIVSIGCRVLGHGWQLLNLLWTREFLSCGWISLSKGILSSTLLQKDLNVLHLVSTHLVRWENILKKFIVLCLVERWISPYLRGKRCFGWKVYPPGTRKFVDLEGRRNGRATFPLVKEKVWKTFESKFLHM